MEALLAQAAYEATFRLPAHLAACVEAACSGTPWWRRRRRETVTFVSSDGGEIDMPAEALRDVIGSLMPLLSAHNVVTITIGPPRPSHMNGHHISDITVTPLGGTPATGIYTDGHDA